MGNPLKGWEEIPPLSGHDRDIESRQHMIDRKPLRRESPACPHRRMREPSVSDRLRDAEDMCWMDDDD